MKRKRLGKLIELSGMMITPVEELTVSGYSDQYGIGIYASCEPLGIIIESVEKRWGLDINGKRVNPDALISSNI